MEKGGVETVGTLNGTATLSRTDRIFSLLGKERSKEFKIKMLGILNLIDGVKTMRELPFLLERMLKVCDELELSVSQKPLEDSTNTAMFKLAITRFREDMKEHEEQLKDLLAEHSWLSSTVFPLFVSVMKSQMKEFKAELTKD